jgi:hypothetical protein
MIKKAHDVCSACKEALEKKNQKPRPLVYFQIDRFNKESKIFQKPSVLKLCMCCDGDLVEMLNDRFSAKPE